MKKVYILGHMCYNHKHEDRTVKKIVGVFNEKEDMIKYIKDDIHNRFDELNVNGYFRIPSDGEFEEGYDIDYARTYADDVYYYRFEATELY